MVPSIILGATVARSDIASLCAGLTVPAGDVVTCDVAGVLRPDVVTVEALLRLRLTARRHGGTLVLRGAGPDLLALIDLLGLTDVLIEGGRQPEEREEPLGVEEVVDRGDPPV